MKKNIWIILTVVIVALLIVFRLANNKKKIEANKNATVEKNVQIPVNTALVAYDSINTSLVKTGTLVPYQEANISASTGGSLVSVSFKLGSQVRQGAVIAQIDNKLLNLRLEASQLQQAKLKKDYERYTVLLKGEATTESNLQEIKYNLDNVTNQISQIRKQMADNQIKAPISGQIIEKKSEAGEFVNMGTVLGKIVDISRLKVDVKVSESDAYKIKNGQAVVVTTDLYPDVNFEGKVSFISQQGDAAHNYEIQVELPNTAEHPLKAGTFVYTDFVQNSTHPVLQIPRSALVEGTKNSYVYTIENDKAVTRKIAVGRAFGANIEVIEGLKEGESVVVNGQINITDGTPISIVK